MGQSVNMKLRLDAGQLSPQTSTSLLKSFLLKGTKYLTRGRSRNFFPTTTIASPRQGTWLTRPEPRPQIEGLLCWVPDWHVEQSSTLSSTTLCQLYLVLFSVGLPKFFSSFVTVSPSVLHILVGSMENHC